MCMRGICIANLIVLKALYVESLIPAHWSFLCVLLAFYSCR